MTQIAVIDLGSNSVRMTITRLASDGSHRLVESARAMVRLSEGMGREGALRSEPMERTLQALGLFARLLQVHQATHVYPVATAAVRQASNGVAFLEEVKSRTGLDFQMITGEEEAHLDFLGVANTVALADFAMIDIGGASTEIAVVRNREPVGKVSIPWGAVNLTEQFGLAGKPSRKKREAAQQEILALLRSCSWIPRDPGLSLVGLGGTVRALAKADRKRRGWPMEALHQYEMTSACLTEWMDSLQGMNVDSRRAVPGIGRERADILAGALIPLRVLLSHLGTQKIMVSGSGIREGLFYRHLSQSNHWPDAVSTDVRGHAVWNLMRLHEVDETHAMHVREMAFSLFDGLVSLHGLGREARELLDHAARLHDVGMQLGYYHHHQHGQYLILASELNGFTHRERLLVSLLVGMHRVDSELRTELERYEIVFMEGDRGLLRRLSVCLMLAEQLDRAEGGAVSSVEVHISPKVVRIVAKTRQAQTDVSLELAAAARCSIQFEKEFGRKLEVVRATDFSDNG